jgi:hypothetical protein
MKQRTILILVIVGGALLSACGTVRSRASIQNPSLVSDRDVRVAGQVTNAFGALGTGGLSGRRREWQDICCFDGAGVPSKGSRVTVSGTVVNGATILGTAYGTTIRVHKS